MAAPQASSRLEMLQARFQQRQLAEKEQKLLQLYDQQQLRAHQVAQRGSAGSNGSNSSGHGNAGNVSDHRTVTRTTTTTHSTSNSQGGGKVRQMFDERRQTTVKGIDKSYPLEPLDNRSRKHQTLGASNCPVNSSSQLKNGNPMTNRRTIVTRRSVRSEANSNVNDGQPAVTYHEEVTREIGDSADRDNEHEEFGDENFQAPRYENGNRRVDRPSQLDIDDVTNENTTQRQTTMAKIHLTDYERSNVTDRTIIDDAKCEQFPDDETIDASGRLPSTGNKAFPSDARNERAKNSVKKVGQTIKQTTGSTTSFTKKRNETATRSGSSSRASTLTTRMEEISRGGTTSPDFGGSVKSRNSSPEGNVGRSTASPIKKSTGVTRVSQMSQDNSSLYYPRRKSEFEKSKTFRRLQLELGESSPEPNEPDETTAITREKHCEGRSTVENIYSSERRPSYSRHLTYDGSSDRPSSRGASQSPVYRRESSNSSIERRDEKLSGHKTSSFDSSTYSSRRHSSSPLVDRDCAEDRATRNERSDSRAGTETPIYLQESVVMCEKRMSEKSKFDYGRRASSSSPRAEHEFTKSATRIYGKSPELKESRDKSASPTRSRETTLKNGKPGTQSAGMKNPDFHSSTSSSRRHEKSWSPIGKGDSSKESPRMARDFSPKRKTSREKSAERSDQRSALETSSHRRESIVQRDERKIISSGEGVEASNYEASTISSRLHSSSPTSTSYDVTEKGEKTSHEVSHERRGSRERSHSPYEMRKSLGIGSEKNKTKSGDAKITSHSEFHTFSSRHASSAPIANERKSDEKTADHPSERKKSQSPIRRPESSTEFEERKKSVGNTLNFASSTYSSRQHSSSPTSITDRDFPEKRSHDASYESPGTRDRSQSPDYQNVSTRTANFEAGHYFSRRPSSSRSFIDDRELPRDQKSSREQSPSYSGSRRGSQSPANRRRSIVEEEEESRVCDEIKTSNFASSTFSSRRRSSSSVRSGDFPRDRETARPDLATVNRRKSGENLRSYELIKNLIRPEDELEKRRSPMRKSPDRKITLEDIESSSRSASLRNETKMTETTARHRVIKKDKAQMGQLPHQEISAKPRELKNSRDTRSRTLSPSPSKSARETNLQSVPGMKAESKKFVDAKKIGSKNRKGLESSSIDERRRAIDSMSVSSKDESRSGRSSSEATVKRHDTFKIAKASVALGKIGKGERATDDEDSSLKMREEFKEKSQLLERIEKIRSTLSRSGRSEQNLRSKEFERTDSVESALRRFDSIGVETEHRVSMATDEIDATSPETSTQIPYLSSYENRIPVNEEIVVKKTIAPLCKPAKTSGREISRTKRNDAESSTIVSRKNLMTIDAREKSARNVKSKTRKDQTNAGNATPRQRDDKIVAKSRESQKRATSMVKKSRLRNEEYSGRGEIGRIDDSPLCKRKLFDNNSESEMENENSRSTIVLTTTTRVTNVSPEIFEHEAKAQSVKNTIENLSLAETSSRVETKLESEPTKILRSIEDIRKSIRRESLDFERQLDRFKADARIKGENVSVDRADDAIPDNEGTLSRVRITKTFKTGDREPLVKIEKTIVKLPIARRLTTSPSPDIGAKRIADAGKTSRTSNIGSTVRRGVPASPAKTPDATSRYGSSESRVPGTKSSGIRISSGLGSREARSQKEISTEEYADTIDGPGNLCEVAVTEIRSTVTTKRSDDEFLSETSDDVVLESREANGNRQESSAIKCPHERSSPSRQKHHSGSAASSTPVSRPASALSSNSSVTSAGRGRSSQTNSSRSKMSTRTKSPSSNGPKGSTASAKNAVTPPTAPNDGLVGCKICGRRFNSDRVTRHEQICSKTATKKRKQFDATIHRVKGTELEPFVKKGGPRKSQADRKAQKPEVKSNWRRKHEDFINAIRSAKQVQAHLAAGGKLSDLPPPPPSDTSDYIQCPHCGRKFNQGAADRHIPKCQSMMHNKPNPRAPPKPKR